MADTSKSGKSVALSIDWDGTLAPILYLPDKSRSINQWDIAIWLYPQNDKRAKFWTIFQTIFTSWAYKDYRFEDINIYKILDKMNIIDVDSKLANVFEYTNVLYKKFKTKYKKLFKDDLYKVFGIYSNTPRSLIHKVFNLSINDIFISHIKDLLWALASLEFYYQFNISIEDMNNFAESFVKFIHQDRLFYIVDALQNNCFVLINTFGIKEVSWNTLKLIMSERYQDKVGEDIIRGNKIKTTAFEYAVYLENRRINGPYSYDTDWILPSNNVIPTAVGKAIRMLTEGNYNWIACGDSNTYDIYMVRLAKILSKIDREATNIQLKTDILSKYKITCNI